MFLAFSRRMRTESNLLEGSEVFSPRIFKESLSVVGIFSLMIWRYKRTLRMFLFFFLNLNFFIGSEVEYLLVGFFVVDFPGHVLVVIAGPREALPALTGKGRGTEMRLQ